MKTLLILIFGGALAFTGYRLADVERQNYAMVVGLCEVTTADPTWINCLRDVQPRTSQWWNLYYGLLP